MAGKHITFQNRQGFSLAAKLDTPEGERTETYVLFAHCFTCTKNIPTIRRIVRGLVDGGLGVLTFDFTGLGDSEGEFSESTFATQTEDLISAAKFLEIEVGRAPTILAGHSFGGTAALYAAREIEAVRGVATIAAPADPAHLTHLLHYDREEIERTGEVSVTIGGRPFRIKKQFIDDLQNHPPEEWLPELKKRVVIFHSPEDAIIDVENAEKIFTSVKQPKSFIAIDGADHLLTNPASAQYVARVLALWAGEGY